MDEAQTSYIVLSILSFFLIIAITNLILSIKRNKTLKNIVKGLDKLIELFDEE